MLEKARKDYFTKSVKHCDEAIKGLQKDYIEETDEYVQEIILSCINSWYSFRRGQLELGGLEG